MFQIIVFSILLIFTFSFFGWNIYKVRSNILIGKSIDGSDKKWERIKAMLLVAFGQKKMFQNIIPAILHFFIYAAFVITSTELFEITNLQTEQNPRKPLATSRCYWKVLLHV